VVSLRKTVSTSLSIVALLARPVEVQPRHRDHSAIEREAPAHKVRAAAGRARQVRAHVTEEEMRDTAATDRLAPKSTDDEDDEKEERQS
jgi:hypothetical protein